MIQNCGRIVPNDVSLIADALREILSDRDKLAAAGRAGRKLVEEKFDWDEITDQMLAVYAEGISRFQEKTHR